MAISEAVAVKLKASIDILSKDQDIIDAVKQIEGGLKTTQDNYGAYMQIMSPWYRSEQGVVKLYIISRSLIAAGANVNGVNWAVKILTGGN